MTTELMIGESSPDEERARQVPARIAIAHSVADVRALAEYAATSRLFPGITTAQAAFSLMMLAQSEGLHPFEALKIYHLIEGKPSMKAEAMLARFQEHGGTVQWLERSDQRVVGVFSHPVQA